MPASVRRRALGLADGFKLALRHRKDFVGVDTYCSFVGCARSGSTLVGSLLDAHPEVVISQELDALRLVQARVPRALLFGLILSKDASFTAEGRNWTGYSYEVPGQWQGRFDRLRVIGDKKAGFTTKRLARRPHLVDRLRGTVSTTLRFVQVTRNPFDNIATMARRSGTPLEVVAAKYFRLASHVTELGSRLEPGELLHVRQEDLVRQPRPVLSELCRFLGVEPTARYLDDCAAIVFPSPRRSRNGADWEPRLAAEIQARIDDVSFLAGYALEDQ